MEILITGGLGVVGAPLTNRLCLANQVTVYTRSMKGLPRLSRPELVKVKIGLLADITAADITGIDLVIHCASTVDNYNVLSDPYIDVQTNIMGTIALLEACKELRPRMLFVSTFAVFDTREDHVANEESLTGPLGTYPATKLCAEHLCKIYSKLHDFHLNICRLTNVYGPGEGHDNRKKGAFNYLVWQAMTGQPLNVYRGGDFMRDYIYIDDAADALVLVAQKAPAGETYLIGTGQPVRFKDLMDSLHRQTGRKSKVSPIDPPRFHDVVGIVNFWADVTKINALGWSATTGYEEGIRRTIASYAAELPAAPEATMV